MGKGDNTMKGMVALMGVIMMAGVLQMIIPKLPSPPVPPPPPPAGFGCPYGDNLFFPTLVELVAHIAEAHPDMPPFLQVDIGWG